VFVVNYAIFQNIEAQKNRFGVLMGSRFMNIICDYYINQSLIGSVGLVHTIHVILNN
jgi:hypothetical protein